MMRVTPQSIMALVVSHTDQCPQCSRMSPCETGSNLTQWAFRRLAELMAPIPEPLTRDSDKA